MPVAPDVYSGGQSSPRIRVNPLKATPRPSLVVTIDEPYIAMNVSLQDFLLFLLFL